MSIMASLSVLAGIIFKVALIFVLLTLPGYCVLQWMTKKRLDKDLAFLLAIPVTIILTGMIFIILFSLKTADGLSQIIYWLVFIAAGAWYAVNKFRKDTAGPSGAYQTGLLFAFLSVLISICFVATGHSDPAQAIRGWEEVAGRNPLHPMPLDNGLQYYAGLAFTHHLNANLFYPFNCSGCLLNISDRTPLFGTLYAIQLLATGSSDAPLYWNYELMGVVLNSLYLIPLYLLLMRLFHNRRIAGLISAALILNTFVFFNTWYTWPKLMCVYFVLTAVFYVVSRGDFHWQDAAATGICLGLAVLFHNGAALSIPCLILYQSMALWRKKKSSGRAYAIVGLIFIFIASFVIVQLPWDHYRTQFGANRNAHLKSHYFSNINYLYSSTRDLNPDALTVNGHKLPNLESFDKLITKTTLHDWVRDFFKSTTLWDQFKTRLSNLGISLYYNGFQELLQAIITGQWNSYLAANHDSVFFWQIPAIGSLNLAFGILFLILFFFNKKITARNLNINMSLLMILLSLSVLSMAFNILLKFGLDKGSTNQALPYFELILVIALTAGLAFSTHWIIRMILMTFIVLQFVHYVYFANVSFNYPIGDFFNVMLVLSAVSVLLIPLFPLGKKEPTKV